MRQKDDRFMDCLFAGIVFSQSLIDSVSDNGDVHPQL